MNNKIVGNGACDVPRNANKIKSLFIIYLIAFTQLNIFQNCYLNPAPAGANKIKSLFI